MTNEITELMLVVEELRSEKYPELPAELLNKILETEAEFMENRSKVLRKLEEIVNALVDEEAI